MSAATKPLVSPAEYLARERAAHFKSEFLSGEMFAMSGATREHVLASGNVAGELRNQLRDSDCEVYQSDMRVKVSASGLYTYPDVSVVCGGPQFEDANVDTLLNPRVIVEVLSESTEAYDRGAKFEHYRRIPTLAEYVLVAQDKYHVEVFSRQPDGRWLFWETNDPGATVKLTSIGCELRMADIYARIELPPPQSP